jgi:hypothetical protein
MYFVFMTLDPRLLSCVWDITVDKTEERELTAFETDEERKE